MTGIATVGVGTLQAGHVVLGLQCHHAGHQALMEMLHGQMVDEGESVTLHKIARTAMNTSSALDVDNCSTLKTL